MTVSTRSYRYVETTAPTVEPVTLAQAKAHLRVDHAHEDDYITARIVGARKFIENQTRRVLIETTRTMYLDEFPDEIRPPGGTLMSVTWIKYYDTDGVLQTMSSSDYVVDVARTPGAIYLAYDESWPSIRAIPNAIEVKYKVGYGAAASNVPGDLIDAVLMLVAHRYENREAAVGDSLSAVPLAVQTIILNNKIQEFF